MNYGSQAISKVGVLASSDTPLGLDPVDQDCESNSDIHYAARHRAKDFLF